MNTSTAGGAPEPGRSSPGFDVVVVGAGVVGLAIAAALAKDGRAVLILEKEAGIARGITSRSSEVIHAGLYYPAGSLKAQLCVSGRRALYAYCEARRVPHRRLGKWIVASSAAEQEVLVALQDRGEANGVEGLEAVSAEQLRREEPEVRAEAALLSKSTGIIDAHALCLSLLAEAEASSAVLASGRSLEALGLCSSGWRLSVRTLAGQTESIDAGVVVDAAGLGADEVAGLAGLDVDALGWRQHPCKGDYFVSKAARRVPLSRLVYPVPAESGLGIHVTMDLAGALRFGPDAEFVGSPRYDLDPAKAAIFRRAVARYLPSLAEAVFEPAYAGIRPKLSGPGEAARDFVIEEASAHGAPGLIACLGIESPGLTAALAIGERVRSMVSV